MGKTTAFAGNFLKLILNATALANLADNASSSPLTNLYLSLHTADPGVGGSQTTSEAAYGSYARVAVARTTGGWTITSNAASPVALVVFPAATSGTETETYAGVGSASSGAGNLYWSGALSPTIAVVTGVTPELKTTSTITET